jgi:predicted small metal-binding protein
MDRLYAFALEVDVAELLVRCACGLEIRGAEDDVVAKTQEHGRQAHNMDVSRKDVLAMATPVSEE